MRKLCFMLLFAGSLALMGCGNGSSTEGGAGGPTENLQENTQYRPNNPPAGAPSGGGGAGGSQDPGAFYKKTTKSYPGVKNAPKQKAGQSEAEKRRAAQGK